MIKISEEDEMQITSLVGSALKLIKDSAGSKAYKLNSNHKIGSGVIELSWSFLLLESSESVLVLDKEYKSLLLNQAFLFIETMQENIENRLFGFGERPLYEFITYWFFLEFFSSNNNDFDKARIKTLLFYGYYKFVTENTAEILEYINQRNQYILSSDEEFFSIKDEKVYFKRLWDEIRNIVHKISRTKERKWIILKYTNNNRGIVSSQSMRIHANPLSLNEAFGNIDSSIRRKLLLGVYTFQLIGYLHKYSDIDVAEIYTSFEEYFDNQQIEFVSMNSNQ